MAKKWRCTVCGYIHEGPEAPEQCPMCKVGKEKFVEVVEKEGDLEFVTEHVIGDGKGASKELWVRPTARVIPKSPRLTSVTHGKRPSTLRSSPS